MKRVLTFGVFDYFHFGHLMLLEHARMLGDYLIVAVQRDEAILKYKPSANCLYSFAQRKHLIESLRIVDQVVAYSNVDEDIQRIDFDVLALGEDQRHNGFCCAMKWCWEQKKEVVRMHRTEGVSSSEIKRLKL